MDFKQQYTGLFEESKRLILEPKKFWEEKYSNAFPGNVVTGFYFPIVLLVGVGVFLGEIIWRSESLLSYALFKALREILSYLLQYFIAIPVLFKLLSNNKGTSNRKALRQVLGYSLLPFLIASLITGLFPWLYLFAIVGLYGFYLFATGVNTCLDIPEANRSRYIILSIMLIILIFGMTNVISWKILQEFYGA